MDDFNEEFGDDFDDALIEACYEAEKNVTRSTSKTDGNGSTCTTSVEVSKSCSSKAVSEECKVKADAVSKEAVVSEIDHSVNHSSASSRHLSVLKQYFGFKSFRDMQWKIIRSILVEKRDNCVVLATGYGKSLLYQYPPVYSQGSAMIISPLISLMEDQVLALSVLNIKACFLGTAQKDMGQVTAGILRGEYRVIYLTPEFATQAEDLLRDINKKVGITLIAIDEAHCVSQWGHEFRTSYRHLGNLKTIFPNVPMMALTATAAPEVRKDIVTSLKLKNPAITVGTFDRPNLYLSVSEKSNSIKSDLKSLMIEESDGTLAFDGPTIIYCPTKKATEEVGSVVQNLGVSCDIYHAGLSLTHRKTAHHKFARDQLQVIVATVAFGMGIDKHDVRQVIHYGAARDIESYYQEMGRAGRDGQPSRCHMFYSNKDFLVHNHFITEIKNEKYRSHRLQMQNKFKQYLSLVECRRRFVLDHFGHGERGGSDQSHVMGTTDCCDNCRNTLMNVSHTTSSSQPDLSADVEKCLLAIRDCGESFGMVVPIMYLRGSTSQRVPAHLKRMQRFNQGTNHSEKWWKALGNQLLYSGYLQQQSVQGGFGFTIQLTGKARQWLSRPVRALQLRPNQELAGEMRKEARAPAVSATTGTSPAVAATSDSKILSRHVHTAWYSTRQLKGLDRIPKEEDDDDAKKKPVFTAEVQKLQNQLYAELQKKRADIADINGIVPFYVMETKSVLEMANNRISDVSQLSEVDGMRVSEAQIQKFGRELCEFVREFCARHHLQTNLHVAGVKSDDGEAAGDSSSKQSAQVEDKYVIDEDALKSLSAVARESYELFEMQGKSLEEVCRVRNVKSGTVVSNLCDAILSGLPLDTDRLRLTSQRIGAITEAIHAPPIHSDVSRLRPIKDVLPDYVTYDDIKLTIAILQRRYGFTQEDSAAAPVSTVASANTTSSSSHSQTTASSASNTSGWKSTASSTQQQLQSTTNNNNTAAKSKRKANKLQYVDEEGEDGNSSGSCSSMFKRRKLPSWM